MKVIRSCKCSIAAITSAKRALLFNEIIPEYGRSVNFFIDKFQDQVPHKMELKAEVVNTSPTWLTTRLKQASAREAISLLQGARKLPKSGKPHHRGKLMHVTSTIAKLEPTKRSKYFDCWLHLQSIGKKIKLNLPIKLHKQFHKLSKMGRRLESYVITPDYVQFAFEIETGEKKNDGQLTGLDTGINALATLNDGTIFGTDIKDLVENVKRKKHGSNKQQTARRALRQRMDEIAKEVINSCNMKLLVVEDLKKLNHQSKFRRRLNKNMRRSLGIWAYRYWLNRIQMATEDNRVSFRRIPPAYTSQRCSACSHTERENRNGKLFLCRKCDYTDDADVNAAKNILFRFTSGPYGAAFKT